MLTCLIEDVMSTIINKKLQVYTVTHTSVECELQWIRCPEIALWEIFHRLNSSAFM